MKITIAQVEQQFEQELKVPLKNLLHDLHFSVSNSQVRVELLKGRKGPKARRTASADNWSPTSGGLRIWFEATEEAAAPKETVKQEISGTTPPATVTTRPEVTEQSSPIADVVRALAQAESRPGWDFVALKKFRDEILPSQGFDWTATTEARQSILADAIAKRLILTNKVLNPRSPQFPVTAIRLNRLMPEVQQILGKQIESRLDFTPVEIRGESLSATILRERR